MAFVAHMTIDWDWDMAAAALVFLLFAGVAAAYVRGRRAGPAAAATPAQPDAGAPAGARPALRRRLSRAGHRRAGAGGTELPAAVPVQRALSRAIVLASDSRTSAAVDQARRAHRLDPLAVDPLFTLALVEQQQGQASAALATLEQAVRLQPQNYATYYELGLMQLNVLGPRTEAAAVASAGAWRSTPTTTNSSDELERGARAAPAAP